MWLCSVWTMVLLLLASPVFAEPPEIMDLVQKMKEVFEPAQPSTRTVRISVNGENGEALVWLAHEGAG